MARDVVGLVLGMELLEPGFTVADRAGFTVGRFRVDADPLIEAAIDRALAVSEWEVTDIELPRWHEATASGGLLLVAEAWETDRELVARRPEEIGSDVVGRLKLGASLDAKALASAQVVKQEWGATLDEMFRRVDVIATPTLMVFPPGLDGGEELLMARCTLPVNLAGVPALALPVPTSGALPGSLQLIGPMHSEEMLLAAGLVLESAISTL
jgi:Asp-tRNA(Asn)/Glu-tRNA(Gln) amidotransferase A subunit family amidase